MITNLQRVIFWDLLKVFGITLVSLTGLFVLGGLVAEASQRGLAPAQVLMIIPLMVPSMLPYTIPAATLFATCNVYGRLAKDNEITALRAAGANLYAVLGPGLLLGALTSAAAFGLYLDVIPRSCRAVRDRLVSNTNEVLYALLKRNGCLKHPKLPYVLFVREVRGDRLIDAVFKRKAPKSDQYDTVARARWATLRVEAAVDPRTGREASDVVVSMANCVFRNDANKGVAAAAGEAVGHQEYRERLPGELFADKDKPRACDLAWPELLGRAAALRARERERAAGIARDEARAAALTPHERAILDHRKDEQRYALREYRSFETEIMMRPALALGCLCFALAGGPIGIWTNRADFLSSFVIGFLPAVLLYYPLVMCGTNLAKDGKLPPLPAIWTANVIFIVVALYLCRRVARR